ncbi:MAG: hypothetical protein Q8P18_32770 [Pseudomonadota bacterium]|nr:hypothetical protein [Pseudomonadota bacterium]
MPIVLPSFDLAGTWALEVVVSSTSRAPILGEVRSASRSRLLVHVTPNGDVWTQRQELCTSSIDGGSKLAKVILPRGWVKAMPPRTYTVTVTPGRNGWVYAADSGVQTVGYDDTRGPMPTRGADPQVIDSDGDGRPGATVLVRVPAFGTGEIYLAHRGHSRLEGRVVNANRIEGRVVMLEMTQVTLGASRKVFDFSPVTRPDPARSTFAMWRVDGDAGCDATLATPASPG